MKLTSIQLAKPWIGATEIANFHPLKEYQKKKKNQLSNFKEFYYC